MASTNAQDPDTVMPSSTPNRHSAPVEKESIAEIERTVSVGMEKKDMQNYDKVDKELAKYVAEARVHITGEKSNELLKLIDRRVLVIMITTYFLQAIDKGTLTFSSIMGIVKDTGLVGNQVRISSPLPLCVGMCG